MESATTYIPLPSRRLWHTLRARISWFFLWDAHRPGLMLGDAPGDAAAAGKNGILFYPIRPLEETDSWQEFYQEYLDAFLEERYEGELQRKAEERFRRLLPETPPWKQEAKRES